MISNFSQGVFLVDFEFHSSDHVEGNMPDPVCMVVLEVNSGVCQRYWRDELQAMSQAPFPTGDESLLIAYFASAELDCFCALGWPYPKNLLDLYVEFRCLTNGTPLPHGRSLLGALMHFAIPSMGGTKKEAMRDLVLRGGPWNSAECEDILAYCEADVRSLSDLLTAMQDKIDWPRALLRGRYMKAVSAMQCTGVPIDMANLNDLHIYWGGIQEELIQAVDQHYGVYDGRTFRSTKFEAYLESQQMFWPRLESGELDLKEETFRERARIHPQLRTLHELRTSLAQLRTICLTVGTDGRNRCLLSPFSSKTGRNQPSTECGQQI